MSRFEEKIKAYLTGKLEDLEKKEMEKAISEDTELKKAVVREKVLMETLNLLVEEDLKKQFFNKKLAKKVIFQRMAIAAGFLLLISSGIAFWWANTQLSDQKLLADFYTEPIIPTQKRSIESSPSNLSFLQAVDAFNKETPNAIPLLTSLQSDSIYHTEATYLLAHCYFRQANYTQAAEQFSALKKETNLPVSISTEEIEVNRLLASFGAGELPQDSLQQIVHVLESLDKSQAKDFRSRLNHPLRKLFY